MQLIPLRERVHLLKLIDLPGQLAQEAQAVHLPPVLIALVGFYLVYLFLREEGVILVGGAYRDAVRAWLDFLNAPECGGGVVVEDNQASCTDKQLAYRFPGNVVALIGEEPLTGGALHLAGRIHGKEFQLGPVVIGIYILAGVPMRVVL